MVYPLNGRDKTFFNLNVNKQVSRFNETIIDITENFIPHETVTCNNNDFPWITKKKQIIPEEK